MTQVTALILAGGQSSRMGYDKALIDVEGTPLLRRTCEVALACTPTVKVVTPWPDRYQAVVPAAVAFVHEQFLAQEVPQSHGPLVGLAQGLAQVDSDWVLALACDLPHLKAAVLQAWARQLESLPPTTLAYLPQIKGRWEPLCGFYRRSCLPLLEAFIQKGGRSFQRWLDQHPVTVIAEVDPALLFNLNTPGDVASLRQTISASGKI
ncbi:MAG: molybdenum cofactor guanylyltransferase [Cyanobacteria bacterium Co-bin13]|nr:molybdenum cofactor guanylyltransferase [Cyanobacteria bacterium Co-bin13]